MMTDGHAPSVVTVTNGRPRKEPTMINPGTYVTTSFGTARVVRYVPQNDHYVIRDVMGNGKLTRTARTIPASDVVTHH
jgi:hypothetical protein